MVAGGCGCGDWSTGPRTSQRAAQRQCGPMRASPVVTEQLDRHCAAREGRRDGGCPHGATVATRGGSEGPRKERHVRRRLAAEEALDLAWVRIRVRAWVSARPLRQTEETEGLTVDAVLLVKREASDGRLRLLLDLLLRVGVVVPG